MASAHRLWMLLLVVTVQSTQSTSTTTTATSGPMTTTVTLPNTTMTLAPPSSPPSAPTFDSRTTNSLTISWTGPANVSYMVQHAVVGGILSDSFTNRTSVLSATIDGLTPGQSYDVVVIAYSGVSDVIGTAGPNATFTAKPSPPTGLKAAPSNRNIALVWGYATNDVVHGFSLRCTPSIDGCSNSIWTSVGDGSTRTYNLNNALYGQEYSFSLRAESGAGTSRDVFSEVDTVSIEIAYTNIPDVTVGDIDHESISISWTRVSDDEGAIQGYYVSAVVASSGELEVSAMVPSSDLLEYTLKPLTPYTKYKIFVLAYNDTGNGTSRDNTTASTSQYNPEGEPKSFRTVSQTSSSVMLSWEEIDEELRNGVIQGYTLMYNTSTESLNVDLQKAQRSHNVTGLEPYTLYRYTLTGYVKIGGQMLHGPPALLQAKTEQAVPVAVDIPSEVKAQWVDEGDVRVDEIIFTLTDDISQIFSKEQGEITHYQILVLASQSNEGVVASNPPQTWRESRAVNDNTKPYAIQERQDSLYAWRTTTKSAAAATIVIIGRNKDCSADSEDYCNGPLYPNTQYCIYLRGWTVAGYADSQCIVQEKTPEVQTANSEKDPLLAVIGVLSALAVIAICSTVVLAIRYYKQWSKEKEPIESSVMSPQSTSDYEVAVSAPVRDLPADNNKVYVNMLSMGDGDNGGSRDGEYETLQNVSTGDEYDSLQTV